MVLQKFLIELVVVIPSAENHRGRGLKVLDFLENFAPAHFGHDHIQQNQVDFVLFLIEHLEGLDSIGGGQHGVSLFPQ